MTIRVATLNIGPGADLELPADVLACQEATDQRPATRTFAKDHPDWAVFHSILPGRNAVPILARRDLGHLRVTYHLAVGRRWVGPKGAGPTYSKAKYVTHLTVGTGLHVLNTHLIPSATRSEAYLGPKEWAARRRHFRDHVAAIVALVDTLAGDVILCGDLNATPDFELLAPLHALGFVGWTTEPTEAGRPIDHVLILLRPRLTQTRVRVIGTRSDHDAAVATFEERP